MSLHTRLVVTILALLAVALFVALGATFGAIWDWSQDRPDAGSTELRQRVLVASLGAGTAVLALAALVANWTVRRGLRPLREITRVTDAVSRGDLTQRAPARPSRTELGRLSHELNGMLDALQETFDAKTATEQNLRTFLADASHELRTPVASIRGYAELFRRGAVDRPRDLAMAMTRIESEAARMSLLVDAMTSLSRLDHALDRSPRPVNVTTLLTDAAADFSIRHPDRRLTLNAAPALPVTGVEVELRQLFTNLLANAAQHTPPGTTVQVAGQRAGDAVVVTVSDDGPGIAPAERSRVFDRFYRGPAGSAAGARGHGLGLAIAAAVVAQHAGAIAVEDAPGGGGACFTIRLPAPADVSGAQVAMAASAPDNPAEEEPERSNWVR